MNEMDGSRRAFVADLAEENRRFYGTQDGLGSLRVFELTFEHRWLYLFELVQNAVDAGARSIALRLVEDGDALIFQHDGDQPLDREAVKALSKVFLSTKGASSVGFMGIGFKSVFGRFQEARISGFGWKFRYEVSHVTGEIYGDVQRNLLGAVVPIWDSSVTGPEIGFTTRFELRQRANSADLRDDLAHLLSDEDRTLLAILALAGLKRLETDNRTWELSIDEESDGTLEATALSEDESRRWCLFLARYEPSRSAVASFLEHRRIRPPAWERDQVYSEAARSRQVVGLLPLDSDGSPAPPARGRIYATLATEVTLPIGLHINADWLLNISRSGLREIEANPWQRDIVNGIADVVASFLGWTARNCCGPVSARAAFAALAPPSAEAGGIEALLADDRWLARLRAGIEGKAVLPVWAEDVRGLAFATPGEAIVAPRPMAEAFEEQPALRPALLLSGPVVMDDVLGDGARELLKRAGVLAEMSPQDLERAWPGGLAAWWATFVDDEERRPALFRLWAAVAELTTEAAWRYVSPPCVRTSTGRWLPVGDSVFFDEELPSEREPGGTETRQLMQPFIPEQDRVPNGWITALRREANREDWSSRMPLTQARRWVEKYARHVSLREVVGQAVGALASSPTPAWAALTSLGQWAKHRNRPDVLTWILVESSAGPTGVRIGEAVLAAPYVKAQSRRLLFPGAPVVSTVYLERDANADDWRTFFEGSGVRGPLNVVRKSDHAYREERGLVASFLGVPKEDIRQSNNSGYDLFNFDIDPELPSPDAPEELRKALAPWIEDGCARLKHTGRRRSTWFYFSRYEHEGTTPSLWAIKLADLAWVPCNDGALRRPRDVLRGPDAARIDAPVATLSSELVDVLEQEGVTYGGEVPGVTKLRELSALGSQLDASALAQLIRECREEIATDADRKHLEQVLEAVTVPVDDGQRVPIGRIVLRIGAGRLRGSLGGWVVSHQRIDEVLRAELDGADFPLTLPDTTTGQQALAYIRSVWKEARSGTDTLLASKVRDVLPTAYAYCLEDCASDDSLAEQWRLAMPEAMIYAEREWISLAEGDDVFFDDIKDRRFIPGDIRRRTVTGGHLGSSETEQLRAVEALGLRRLSSSIDLRWREGDVLPATDWLFRFDTTCRLLQRVREGDTPKDDKEDAGAGLGLRLVRVEDLVLEVSSGGAAAERVPVNARMTAKTLTVAGRPIQFGSDAAKEILRHLTFGQRAGLAADLTGMLVAIGDEADFDLAAEKFRRSFAPDFDLLGHSRIQPGAEQETIQEVGGARPVGLSHRKVAQRAQRGTVEPDGVTSDRSATGGSYTRDRALAGPETLVETLRGVLKGELIPGDDDDDTRETASMDGRPGAGIGDEEFRDAVIVYERKAGREPVLGDPHQAGWDVRSVDPKTGIVRLIEVKGKGCLWIDDEVVELSRAQVREAFEASSPLAEESWWLYVVEKTEGGYRVLPVGNPAHAAKWILCGRSWRALAEAEVTRDTLAAGGGTP